MGPPDGASVGKDVGVDECVTVGPGDGAPVGSNVGALVAGLVDGAPVGVDEGKLVITPTNSPMVGCSVSPILSSETGASTGTSIRESVGSRNSNP